MSGERFETRSHFESKSNMIVRVSVALNRIVVDSNVKRSWQTIDL